jgi:hypothetical protein
VGAQFGEEAVRLVQVRAVGRTVDGHLAVAATCGGVPIEHRPGLSMLLLRAWAPQKLAEIVVVSLKAWQ